MMDFKVRSGASYLIFLLLVIFLTSCERSYWDPTVKIGDPKGHVIDHDQFLKREELNKEQAGQTPEGIKLGEENAKTAKTMDSLQKGTGNFVRKITPPTVDTTPGDITLNFDGTDIREVVKVILGDLLKVSYVLNPSVQGVVSLQTGRPLKREYLIPTLETLLRMNNAAIVYSNDTYEIVPLANAVQGKLVPQLGDSNRALPAGYSIRVIPLQYIGAEEMSNILQPLAPEGSIVRVDNLRNLLVIAATSPEMGNLLDTIRVFDVDWMSGLSVGLFALEYAKANEVATQLQGLLSEEEGSTLKGLFRFVPVESANAVLVVSPQQSYIQQARTWVERLDMAEASGSAAERLFVYRVKHGDAEMLADMLSELFGGSGENKRSKSAGSVAPGLGRSTIGGQDNTDNSTSSTGKKGSQSSTTKRKPTSREIELTAMVNIVADPVNNSLLIRSNPRDFKKILDAVKQLDILPLQVLVEATIVEITLSGDLKYGIQWDSYGLATKNHRSRFTLDGSLDSSSTSGTNGIFPGFNWAVISRPDTVRAILSTLASESLVNVLSSPSVMVMDNQKAEIQVGQDVPVATQQQQSTTSTTTDSSNIVNSISYKETGVKLKVKPRVTPGGLVQMEIEQEVSTALKTDSSSLNSPTIQKRTITSSVAVRSNQAVILGGLIQDQGSDGKQGIPGLYNLPFIGSLFGERTKESKRTELVVVLTPKVIANNQDIESITQDFRNKIRGLNVKF